MPTRDEMIAAGWDPQELDELLNKEAKIAEGGPHFDGSTYDPDLDHVRLTGQLQRVYNVMKDSRWRTLNNISVLASGPESSIGARIRDLRKPKFGEYQIERKRDSINKGTFLYRLVKPQGDLF